MRQMLGVLCEHDRQECVPYPCSVLIFACLRKLLPVTVSSVSVRPSGRTQTQRCCLRGAWIPCPAPNGVPLPLGRAAASVVVVVAPATT
jgi:hypothetical protein